MEVGGEVIEVGVNLIMREGGRLWVVEWDLRGHCSLFEYGCLILVMVLPFRRRQNLSLHLDGRGEA